MIRRITLILFLFAITITSACAREQWTRDAANEWYARQPWPVGANYVPANAINQLEMWQPETFDPAKIDTELGWAEKIGMNTMRVFLHDLLWKQDAQGFTKRINTFLEICSRHHIRPMFVLFDSCWDPSPHLGPQHPPIPGVHNSGWVQSPGLEALSDASQKERLQAYVVGVVGAFAHDKRILAWDVWNEPDNGNSSSYVKLELQDKQMRITKLLPEVFSWARSVDPIQPLTSGIWQGVRTPEGLPAIEHIQLEQSDVTTFHNYGWPEQFQGMVSWLKTFGRPLICTEYMARGAGSTFDTILPIAKREHVGAINWGLVVGKTQTNLPWDSWQRPYVVEQPTIWFHEVFQPDGKPYRQHEADLIRELTSTR